MKRTCLHIFMLFIPLFGWAQKNGTQYKEEGNLDSALMAYGMQYMKSPENADNTYGLATVLALQYQLDTAFYFLNQALKENASLLPLTDSDFLSLSNDPRWEQIEENQFRKYEAQNGKIKNTVYAKQLLRMIMIDQCLDYYIDQAKATFMKKGQIPHWYYPLGAYQQELIVNNFSEMKVLIQEYGWPTYSMVGELAADAPLLVINHHAETAVRKSYLSQIENACRTGEGSCVEFAKIQDRILVDEDKPQIYGMQFRYTAERSLAPFSIENPQYVDQRRKEIGLEPLKDYLKRKINYDWKVEQKNK
ncbi:MAG: hypothetical protein ACI905_001423 [Roseivirga sp.]|jgi:hypothetical protein